MSKGIILGCVDPRLHGVLPEAAALMGVEKVYIHRVPGPDGVLVRPELEDERKGALASLRRLHGVANANAFALIAHTDCAGHQVSDDEHREHTREAARKFREEINAEVPVHALVMVRGESDDEWSFETLGTY
jgi:carbonic anhydrase